MGVIEKKVKGYLDKIKKEDVVERSPPSSRNKGVSSNKKINAFLSLNPNVLAEAREVDRKKKKGKLAGMVIGVKSNICVSGLEVNCASKVLEGWKASYDATIIGKIKAEDGVIIGMLNMDEFACGAGGISGAFGPTKNPIAEERVPGGSSGGSAAAVAAGFCDVALGSDTGGSIRVPASFCGVIGVKPSYGLVSRHGLIDLSMSLDQIGPIGKNIEDCEKVLDVIKGKDERDTISRKFDGGKDLGKKVRIGVVKVEGLDSDIEGVVDMKIKEMGGKGFDIKEIEVKYLDLAVQTYYLLVYAEFFSATRRFDGRRYGKEFEDVCGEEVLRRVLGGSEITKAEVSGDYYKKALEVKKLIKKEFDKAFENVDCLILPTYPKLPWKVGEKLGVEEEYNYDALTIPANLAGVCAISLPVGDVEGVPVGMQVICNSGEEKKMFEIARDVVD